MARISRMTRKRLGELLLEEGLVTQEQLDAALEIQRRDGLYLGEVLVQQRIVEEKEIARVLSHQYGLPFLDPARYEINDAVEGIFPEAALRKYHFVPLDDFGNSVLICSSGDLDPEKMAEIEEIAGKRVHVAVGASSDVRLIIENRFMSDESTLTGLGSMLLGEEEEPPGGSESES
jgi:type IV pilus assembly protein PilB